MICLCSATFPDYRRRCVSKPVSDRPETGVGTFTLDVDATHLAEYKEFTNNPDGTQSVNDLTGRAPDETFFRAVSVICA
jgi:hypothetical protein